MVFRVLVPFVAAVAGAVLGAVLAGSGAPVGSSALPVDGADCGRLDELLARIESLESENDAPVLRARRGPRESSRAALRALARRVALLEEHPADRIAETDAAPVQALIARARSLRWKMYKAADSVAAWRKVLAQRSVSNELRVEALRHVGWGLRELKRHDEEAVAYQRLAELAGPDSTVGARALYDLSWIRSNQKDIEGAYRVMMECVRAPGTVDSTRRAAVYHAADWAHRLDYRDEARNLANELLRMCGDRGDGTSKMFAGHARSILASVDGR